MIGIWIVMALLGLAVLFAFAHLPAVGVLFAAAAVGVAVLTAWRQRTHGVDT